MTQVASEHHESIHMHFVFGVNEGWNVDMLDIPVRRSTGFTRVLGWILCGEQTVIRIEEGYCLIETSMHN
jgi:hypothetical protein